MGNLAFDISKIVDLNKTVNLDIDKNVDVNVNIDDLLATAEADAEAFGIFALAEVDAYTFVNEGGGMPMTEDVVVDVDALGNTTLTDQDIFSDRVLDVVDSDGGIVGSATYSIPESITVNFTAPDGNGLPDIDDLNWTGGLIGNEGVEGDTQIPTEPVGSEDPGFSPRTDKVLDLDDLSLTAELQANGSVIVFAEYELVQPWEVDFGNRTITGDIKSETKPLSIIVPQGTTYLVEFLDEDGNGLVDPLGTIEAKEYEFEAFPEAGPGQWVFGEHSFDIETYVQVGEEIFDIGFGDWDFQALGTITINGKTDGDGEAFAYAESTSAVDLNGEGMDVL